MIYVTGIDPSDINIGYGQIIFDFLSGEIELNQSGTYKPKGSLIDRLSQFQAFCKDDLGLIGPLNYIFIEKQEHWKTARGRAAEDDILKSAMFSIVPILVSENKKNCFLIPPIKWKGNLPDKILKKRIKNKVDYPNNLDIHAIEAVGIALYGLEVLKEKLGYGE